MRTSTVTVIVLLIVNLIVSLVFVIVGLFMPRGKKAATVYLGVFFFFCPLVGPSCYAVYCLLLLLFRTSRFDSASLTFSTDRTDSVVPSDEQSEMNYISIQDALVMSDTVSLRQLLLNLLKERTVLQTPNITHAIASDDAESSHYAATAVTNFISEFQTAAQIKLFHVKQMPDDIPTLVDAIAYILPVLQAKIMDDIGQRSYVYMVDDMMNDVYGTNKWYLTSKDYLDITDILLDIRDYSRAGLWASRAGECRAGELNTYKCSIHLYYVMQDRDALFTVLDEVKKSNVVIDREILDLIRMLG